MERKLFVFKKGFRELSIVFGDFLILRFCPKVCFLSSSIWVVCFMGCLWAACPGIPQRWGVVFYNPINLSSFMFSLISKVRDGLGACRVCLETHHLLNSAIFIFFPFERGILWNERIVNWHKLSPSHRLLWWEGEKPTVTFLGRHCLLWWLWG